VTSHPDKAIYLFEEGNASLKDLLGSKGANLCEMARMGLPVPSGFIVTTTVCRQYLDSGYSWPEQLTTEIQTALKHLEKNSSKQFGNPDKPLLLSVRSGSKISMPGMMETILNLGLNEITLQGLVRQSGNERFAWDTYRRFIAMFANVVLGIPQDEFEQRIETIKNRRRIQTDTELETADFQTLVEQYKALILEKTGQLFPDDPVRQLQMAIEAVFKSWNAPRAIVYRDYHHISHNLGTAVNVQTMVFGNLGSDSATGVAFSRNPATGEPELYGEYLVNAQGEDVVAGIRTPFPIAKLAEQFPDGYKQLHEIVHTLERHYKDIQDVEFTIEKNSLYILQTRTGKRTIQASVKIAVDMAHEGLISSTEALLKVDANQLSQLLAPTFDKAEKQKALLEKHLLGTGINASPGAAVGRIVFSADAAVQQSQNNEKVILVRPETSPDDIHGLLQAQGILTTHGGNTSHAAVVARGLGKPCITGCEAFEINMSAGTLKVDGKLLKAGDFISIDGETGEVFEGDIPTILPILHPNLAGLLEWADRHRKLEVWANADTAEDAKRALEYGATGIGLCRTEHMFMEEDRLPAVHDLILAETFEQRRLALEKLLLMQQDDFRRIFEVMDGYSVTIRLLDPPLHEFLPKYDQLLEDVLRLWCKVRTGPELEEKEALLKRVAKLRESNPMMGFRGCRIGLLYPEIYQMQVQAILEAAIQCKKAGIRVKPKIMIPLISDAHELKILFNTLKQVAEAVMESHHTQVGYGFGTMIETPRAALIAKQLAETAEFFSFGTNDLTQLTFGFSRDDAEEKFLRQYLDHQILEFNPFKILDQQGVGRLMRIACEEGRQARPSLKLSICGEHAGEPASIRLAHQLGLHAISCSSFQIPTARLAAAQASISEKEATELSYLHSTRL
jgi:pyruvate,orthophosphate dikinase